MTKNFDDGIKRVHKNLLNSVKGFADINGAVSLAKDAFAIGAQVVSAFADEINKLDDLVDTAKRLDITADALQRFRRASELTSGSVEGIDKALSIFQRNIGDAGMGASGPNKALGILGLDAKSLQDAGLEKAFQMVLLKLEQIPDATKRAAVGADLFGKAAADLTDLMGNSSSAIAQATDDMNKFGVSLNGRTEDIGKAKDAMDRLGMSWSSLKTETALTFAGPGANVASGAALSLSTARNTDWLTMLVEGSLAGIVSPQMAAGIVRRELGKGFLNTMTPGASSAALTIPSLPPQALGQVSSLESDMLDVFRMMGTFRAALGPAAMSGGGFVDPTALLAESSFSARTASGGAGAIDFRSAEAFSALQRSRREDETLRLQKQEVEESKKQTQLMQDAFKNLVKLDVAGLQG